MQFGSGASPSEPTLENKVGHQAGNSIFGHKLGVAIKSNREMVSPVWLKAAAKADPEWRVQRLFQARM